MSQISIPRVVLGGLVAGAVINVVGSLGGILYLENMIIALQARGITLDTTLWSWVLRVTMGFVLGWIAVWLYAGARSRFGPGPKTAFWIGLVLCCASVLPQMIGYRLLDLLPDGVLLSWGVLRSIELIAATLAGAWMYMERTGPSKPARVETE